MKLSIIGPGKVGMALAFAVTLRGFARELVLVGRDRGRLEGEALDLLHGESFYPAPVKIHAGNVADTAGSDVIVFCASVALEVEDRRPTQVDMAHLDIINSDVHLIP